MRALNSPRILAARPLCVTFIAHNVNKRRGTDAAGNTTDLRKREMEASESPRGDACINCTPRAPRAEASGGQRKEEESG